MSNKWTRKRRIRGYWDPIRHPDHPRPRTRREFISQGFMAGGATVFGGGALSLFANPRAAYAALSSDLIALKNSCGIATQGAGKIPFICFDLAGGANMCGSNVLVGGQGGQLDFITTAGYNKMGLPGDMVPSAIDPVTGLDHTDLGMGLGFHSDSAFARGIRGSLNPIREANINGAIIPARSDNDTGNNPHNPMYGIAQAGADGELMALTGSRNSDSGGNSMSPMMMIDPELRPTKVDRPSDVTGLVDTGQLVGLLGESDAVAVLEAIQRVTDMKLSNPNIVTGLEGVQDPGEAPGVTRDEVVRELVNCGYVKAADVADKFGNPAALNVNLDTDIVGPAGIFTQAEFDSDNEFRKTASVMKLVMNGFAGGGCITMGGYDYHGGARAEGEVKDERAGRCMGAVLEYAARLGVPVMMYVFSDGSLSSNGTIDNSVDGRGKGEWTSDNSSTAASFFLVYNPGGRPQLLGATAAEQALHQQIGYFRGDGSVETGATPAANNVNLLVETAVLNYMALHGEQGNFGTLFPNHGLGNAQLQDSLTAFQQIVSGTI